MTSKKDKTHDQKVRNEAFKKLGYIFLGLLLVVNTIQLTRFGGIVERVDNYNKGVVDELGGMRQDVMTFASDMNDIRQFLLLPTRDYSFMGKEIETQQSEEKAATRTESAVYTFLAQLTEEKALQKSADHMKALSDSLPKDAAFTAKLKESGLKIGTKEDNDIAITLKILTADGNAVFALVFKKDTEKVSVQQATGTYAVKAADDEAVKTEILDYIQKNLQQALDGKKAVNDYKLQVEELLKNTDVVAALKAKKISFGAAVEDESAIQYNIVNEDDEILLSVAIDHAKLVLAFDGQPYTDAKQLAAPLVEKIKSLDTASAQEKMISLRRAELEAIFSEPAFQDLLKNDGLSIDLNAKEEYNKLVYPVKDAAGKPVFSFAVELSSGMFKIIKDDEEIDLYSTLNGDGSKKKP